MNKAYVCLFLILIVAPIIWYTAYSSDAGCGEATRNLDRDERFIQALKSASTRTDIFPPSLSHGEVSDEIARKFMRDNPECCSLSSEFTSRAFQEEIGKDAIPKTQNIRSGKHIETVAIHYQGKTQNSVTYDLIGMRTVFVAFNSCGIIPYDEFVEELIL